MTGRGNLTSTTRYDVTAATAASVSRVRYDIAGSPVAQLDPRERKTTIDYTDNFNTTPAAATFAYPKTITDPGGNSSTIQYRFDLGANIWARSPKPEGSTNSVGKTTSRTYSETTGRLTRQTIENNGAYTRYDYPNTGNKINTYTTIADITGVGTIDASDEVLTETILDGAGRAIKTRTENPNSTGGYAGTRTDYDLAGRVIRQSVPTEINSSWNPAGDDNRGTDGNGNPIWLSNEREYDWMGRVTREINTDGTDKLYSYTGCGCAGGLVTTIKGELTDAIGMNNQMQTGKRRTQKIYQDPLGRVEKKEIWDLDGADLYSTIENEYNGRDQITKITESSGQAAQETTFEFDGHGRLKKSHKPENRDSSDNLTYTAFEYNADDTIKKMTDPRGAETIYTYGNEDDSSSSEYRALLTRIQYTSPDTTNIPVPTDIHFTYDPAGNRKYMSDGTGTLAYEFDELSRLTRETKVFAGTLVNAPSGGYKLEYSYHLSGGIKAIKDPQSTNGWEVTYASDKTGKTTSIGASGFGSLTTFATGIGYRAFGGVKGMTYSTGTATNVSLTYDDRLRPATYEAESSANTTDIHNKTYTYNNDGSIKLATNTLDASYSQKYEYDFAGRLKKNDMGGLVSGGPAAPYKQALGYDGFNNLTSRATTIDGTTQREFTAGYTNNRKSSGGYGEGVDWFDAAGNVVYNRVSSTPMDYRSWKFDAAGRVTDWLETSLYAGSTHHQQGEELTFDGDGRTAKRLKKLRTYANPPNAFVETPEYYIYSSVTGQQIAELDSTGQWRKRNFYFNGTVIAEQTPGFGVVFKHTDPIAGSVMQTESDGLITPNDIGRVERAALNTVIPTTEPETSTPPHDFGKGGSTHNPEKGCEWNGAPVHCDILDFVIGAFDDVRVGIRIQGHENTGHRTSVDLRTQLQGTQTSVGYEDERGNWISDEGSVDWFQTSVPFGYSIGQTPSLVAERTQLPQCLRDLLRPFFPAFQVGNWTTISPVDDARFIKASGLGITNTPAMTAGLTEILYDPNMVDLTGGEDKSSIYTIAEEIAHTVQFMAVWDKLALNSPKGAYARARDHWAVNYLSESARIVANNFVNATTYALTGNAEGMRIENEYLDNRYEQEAKAKAESIINELKNAPNPCYKK